MKKYENTWRNDLETLITEGKATQKCHICREEDVHDLKKMIKGH